VRLLDLAAFFADDTADLGGFEDLAVVVAGVTLVEDREGFWAAPDFTGFAGDLAPPAGLALPRDLAALLLPCRPSWRDLPLGVPGTAAKVFLRGAVCALDISTSSK
jgi:hypothetical protein